MSYKLWIKYIRVTNADERGVLNTLNTHTHTVLVIPKGLEPPTFRTGI